MAQSNNNVVYKHSRFRRIVFYTAFMAMLWIPHIVMAQQEVSVTDDLYLVSGVEVDITADNAVEAREQAFDVAQVKAYEVLATRLLSSAQLQDFVTPDINEISRLVRDYEVTNEKLSSVRYNGTYQIRFSKRAFASAQSLDETKTVAQSGDTLVVPFYQRAGRSFLWQANPFMQAWVRARDSGQAGRFIVPVGDIDDITQIRGDQALHYDPSRMNAMRLRYQARQVAMMTVEPKTDVNGTNYIELSLYNAQPYGPELAQRRNIRIFSGEDKDQLYNRVVAEALRLGGKQEERARIVNTTTPPQETIEGPQEVLQVKTIFSSVQEWLQMKKTLESSPSISRVDVQSMSPRSAILNVIYRGGQQNLSMALQQSGFSILPSISQGGMMQLVRGRVAPTVPSAGSYLQQDPFQQGQF